MTFLNFCILAKTIVLNIICKMLSLELSRFCSGFASRAVSSYIYTRKLETTIELNTVIVSFDQCKSVRWC